MRADGEIVDDTTKAIKRKLTTECQSLRVICKGFLSTLRPWLKVCHEVFFLWKSRHFPNSIFEGEQAKQNFLVYIT